MSDLDDLLADLTSGDESRAEIAVSALAALSEDALPALRGLLGSPEVDYRWWAVRVLAQMLQPRMDWLVEALDDVAPEVRQAAALALGGHPHESAVTALVQALSDADSMVAMLACNALAALGGSAVPLLIEAAQHASQSARIHAMRALAEIRDPRAIPVMMHALEEDSAMLHYWAEEGLERLGLNMVYIKPD